MLSTSTLILLWAIALFIIGYLVLLYRYHYRTPDTITILQCTADDFSPDLLRERQPIVCRGMGDTTVFATLRASLSSSTTASPVSTADQDTVYSRLQHIAPWFATPQPIQVPSIPPSDQFQQSQWDVRLWVQLRGTSRVWFVAPGGVSGEGPSNEDGYVEVVLREGDGVFVPFLWWYRVVEGGSEESEESGDSGESEEANKDSIDRNDRRENDGVEVGWTKWWNP